MIEMPVQNYNDDEPMGDNFEYGYYPDTFENCGVSCLN